MKPATLVRVAIGVVFLQSTVGRADPAKHRPHSRDHHKAKSISSKPKEFSISVGGVGRSPEVKPELAERLRALITEELQHTPGVALQKLAQNGFLVDSAITRLQRTQVGDNVEVSCEVSLTVGRLPSHALVMTTSGGATVQMPKLGFRPEHESAMYASALAGAVSGARENLVAFLARQH